MAKKVSLVFYEDKYSAALWRFLNKFQEEVYNSTTHFSVGDFVKRHEGLIYMVLGEAGVPVGFTSFCYNDYYGLREATLGNDFIYLEPAYRKSRAMHLICIQAGTLCQNNNIPLENYYASDDSEKFIGRMKGERIFSTYIFPVDEVSKETERLKTKIRIK